MLKIPSKVSVWLSIALSVVFFLLCAAGAVIMPQFADLMFRVHEAIGMGYAVTAGGRAYVLILAYLALAFLVLADGLLLTLLLRVKKALVFTAASVACIRGVSWCCLLICLLFCGLGVYFRLSFIVAFGMLFLGVCLRVVKNVIEEATEIKSENDLTV